MRIVDRLSHASGSDGTSATASLMMCQPAQTHAERQVLCDGFGRVGQPPRRGEYASLLPRPRLNSDENRVHRDEPHRIVRSRDLLSGPAFDQSFRLAPTAMLPNGATVTGPMPADGATAFLGPEPSSAPRSL
jgi:hypothetical protein